MRTHAINPFRIDIAPDVLGDLRQRLKSTRWSYQVEGTGWDAGVDLNYLGELVPRGTRGLDAFLGRPVEPILIDRQTHKSGAQDRRRQAVLLPIFKKIAQNAIHLDGCALLEIAIHGRG
jgi:hypothetical protein